MASFRKLAIVTTIATLFLVGIGGLVRATKSGLGCGDDWPECNGRLAPALETRAEAIEFAHRFTAVVVGLLILGLALLALRHYRRTPKIFRPAMAALGLVVFQALLGAVVVKVELHAASVAVHLTTALSLLAVEIYLVAAVHVRQGLMTPLVDRELARRAWLMASAVLVLLVIGSFSSVYPGPPEGWPLVNDELVPDLSEGLFAVHFLHRVVAGIVGILLFGFAFGLMRNKRANPRAALFARVALGAFAFEILVGAANVWTSNNAIVVTLHLLTGAVVWSSVVGVAVNATPSLLRVGEREPSGRMALEGGAS